MCYRFEEPIHRFQNMLIDRMVGSDRVPAGDAQHVLPPAGMESMTGNGAATVTAQS
jgi:hypothetical protein